jgi:hypothetical protein
MAITRGQILKELVPGLNAIFGTEYSRYENEHAVLFDEESSNRAFEEEVLFPGFEAAQTKFEGQAVAYGNTGEGYVSRYTMKLSLWHSQLLRKQWKTICMTSYLLD